MKKVILAMAVLALLSLAGIAQAITIDTVAVGNAGNTADSTGYGSVSYNYNIGKYEVTAGQYTAFLNAVAATDTYGVYNSNMANTTDYYIWGCNIQRTGNSGSYSYTVGNGSQTDITNWANRPVNYVSFWDSCRFVNWLGNGQPTRAQDASTTEDGAYTLTPTCITNNTNTRNTGATWSVTSEDEWYKAAYYDPNKGGTGIGGYWLYATRSDTAPANQVLPVDPGNSANYYINNYSIGSPYYRTNVGEFENSASAYGTFDQGGNVWEWNEAIWGAIYRCQLGGSFDRYGTLQSSDRHGFFPFNEYFLRGFRVSEVPGGWQPVPEPSTIIVLLGGIAGCLSILRRSRS